MRNNNMARPLVSIIVPVYKVGKYLKECLESICQQSYRELDIILVDDGSDDDSGKICDSWQEKDARIRVVHKVRDGKNNGVSAARNTGIKMIKGDFVAFVDSDDRLSLDYVATLYEAITGEEKPDVVICNYINLKEQPDGTFLPEKHETKLTKRLMSGNDVLQERFSKQRVNYVVVWNKLYRREIIEKLQYEQGMMFEDEMMLRPLFSSCQRVLCIRDVLYYYRNRKNSIITSHSSEKARCALEWLNQEIRFCRDHQEGKLLYQAEQMYCHEYFKYRKYLEPNQLKMQKKQIKVSMKRLVYGRQVPLKSRLKYGVLRLLPFLLS